jgi:CheY-like chemotaxis protein
MMQHPSILVVDDNADSLFIMERLFDKAHIRATIARASGGEEAIDYLLRHREVSPETLPRLIFMDLAMPMMNGFETIKWIREQPDFKELIVVALSTSYEERDVRQAYEAGADAFMTKYPAPHSVQSLYEAALSDRTSTQFRDRVLAGILVPKISGGTNKPFP